MGLTIADQIRWIEAKIYQEELDPEADFGLWSEVLESLRWLQRLLREAAPPGLVDYLTDPEQVLKPEQSDGPEEA